MTMPTWISEIQALSAPIIAIGAVAITTIGVIISHRQAKTAQSKLRLDMFPLRIAVYNTVVDAMSIALNGKNTDISGDKIRELHIKIRESRFLFDKEIYDYLDKTEEIVLRTIHLNGTISRPDFNQSPERMTILNMLHEDQKWLLNNLRVVANKLAPALKIDEASTFSQVAGSDVPGRGTPQI